MRDGMLRKTPYLYLTAFVSGCVSLALELSAGRLLAPAFGTTEIVWSAIIGLILLYLTAGYSLGGWWADKAPEKQTLYTILTFTGWFIACIPLLSRPMLRFAVDGMRSWNLGQLAGPFVVILGLFALPVTLLATISPFIIRLLMKDMAHSGGTAGRVYAISTAGSFIGALLPNLLLIPNLGTWRTFILLAGVCTITGLGGLWGTNRRRFRWFVISVPVIILIFIYKPQVIKQQSGLIYEKESAYNYIQVVEDSAQRRYLLLNEGQGVHSIHTPQSLIDDNPSNILTGGPWDYFLVAPFFNDAPFTQSDVNTMLVIGLAAGTASTNFTLMYGPKPVHGVEIDPEIVKTGQTFFDMNQSNLTIFTTDGRTFLDTHKNIYSLIVIDAYRLPYIPWHLTTLEFFQKVYAHLDATGTTAINVGHTPSDWRLVDAIVNTMRQVYPSVHIITIENSLNAVVIGTAQYTEKENLAVNLPLIENQQLQVIAKSAISNLREPETSTVILTDDLAPIEQISHALALRYMLTGE